MKLKTLILLIILGASGYWAYGYFSVHFSQEVMAYKRFVKAVEKGDRSLARNLVVEKFESAPFDAGKYRADWLDGERRFTWFTILNRQYSADKSTVTMRVRYSVRVDPPGSDTFYGAVVRKDTHDVTLIRHQSSWLVKSYSDTPTQQLKQNSLQK